MSNFDLSQSTQSSIKVLEIRSGGITFDIKAIFQELNIFDTILFPVVSGNIVILDANNLSSKINFMDAFLNVEISKGEENSGSSTIKRSFRIYNQSDRTIKNQSSEFYILHFVSQELIESLTYTKENMKVSQSFEGSYSRAAEIILKNYLQVSNDNISFIQETKGIHQFIIPNLSPFDALDWLTKRSISYDNMPNFVFFENTIGFNFASLTYLLNEKPIGIINFDIKNVGEFDHEFSGVRDVQVITQSNLIKGIKEGIYSGVHIEFDPYTQTYNEKQFDVTDIAKRIPNRNPHISTMSNRQGNSVFKSHAARTITALSTSGRQTGEAGNYLKINDPKTANIVDDVVNWKFARKPIFENLFQKRIKMTLPGNFIYSSGLNVMLKGFNLTLNSRTDSQDVSTYGKYIIVAARHMIKPQLFETVLEVASDSTNSPVPKSSDAVTQQFIASGGPI
jgi:hypothetical protein